MWRFTIQSTRFSTNRKPERRKKALWYVWATQATHVKAFTLEGKAAFYVLSKSGAHGATKITTRVIDMFSGAMGGVKDSRAKDLDTLIGACQSLHVVCEPDAGYDVPDCEGNPAKFECLACKSFKGVGICSHVLGINHILSKFNIRYELKNIQTQASKKTASGGNRMKPLPALQRARVAEPDSSDEEDERLLALGQAGK